MSRKSMCAMIATLLIAAFVQNTASAQGAANYRSSAAGKHLKADVSSALDRFARGRLSGVHGEAASARIGLLPQRAPNKNSFITQDLNLEGYPRGAD
jgi:hypothetical protein